MAPVVAAVSVPNMSLPVSGPPFLDLPIFSNVYNPGSTPCANNWSVIPAGNVQAGYCEAPNSAQNALAFSMGAVALAVLMLAPGAWKLLAVVPAGAALIEAIGAGSGF